MSTNRYVLVDRDIIQASYQQLLLLIHQSVTNSYMTLQRNNTETWSQTKHQTASKHNDSTVHPRLPFELLQDGVEAMVLG